MGVLTHSRKLELVAVGRSIFLEPLAVVDGGVVPVEAVGGRVVTRVSPHELKIQ